MRVVDSSPRFQPPPRGPAVTVWVDGQLVTAYAGETVAAVLLAAGQRTLRRTTKSGQPRGLFCGIGLCFDCLVNVDSVANVRACVTPVAEGMRIDTQSSLTP